MKEEQTNSKVGKSHKQANKGRINRSGNNV